MNFMTIEKMVNTYGSRKNALKYFLTLKPYKFEGFAILFVNSKLDLERIVIRDKYATLIGDRLFVGDVPKEFSKKHSKILNEYYDLNAFITISQNKSQDNIIPRIGYVITKRDILNELIKEINIMNILEKEIEASMLRTIWYEEIKMKETREGVRYIPKDFHWAQLGQMKRDIILKLLNQEQNYIVYESIENLRKDIEFDYDKFIDNQNELCMKCKHKVECLDDGECEYLDALSKEEKDKWLALPDYEPLSIEKLLNEINMLFLDGLLYLDDNIMEN